MKVSEIVVYPVKSLGGFSLEEHEMLTTGFRFDRQWMVVDENGKFMSQRERPEMARVKTRLHEGSIWMRVGETWERLEGPSPEERRVQVWGSDLRGSVDGNPRLTEYLSDFLKVKATLVTAAPGVKRRVPERETDGNAKIYFADSHPILFGSRKSLDELNAKLETPIPMNRFRVNVVIDDLDEATPEEKWEKLAVGSLNVEIRKRCSRCPITTVDQETGEKKGPEPLATLAKYKRHGSRVYFGVYGWSENEARLKVGDPVRLLSVQTG